MPVSRSGIQLCWSFECSQCRQSEPLCTNLQAAALWLSSFDQDPLVLSSLRQAAIECGHDRLALLDFQTLQSVLAQQIANGVLRPCDANWPAQAAPVGPFNPPVAVPEDTFKPFPIGERASRQTGSSPAMQPSTFGDDMNVHAQVLALASAAAQGVPFCPE